LGEDSDLQYDNSFSTDGEQVAVRFRAKLNSAEVKEIKLREKRKKNTNIKKPSKIENLCAISAQGGAQRGGIGGILAANPEDTFEELLKKTVPVFTQQHFENVAADDEMLSASEVSASSTSSTSLDSDEDTIMDTSEETSSSYSSMSIEEPFTAPSPNALIYAAADPGQIDLFSVSFIVVESAEDATKENLLAAADKLVFQPQSSLVFSSKDYRKRAGHQESRYAEDISKPRYDALRSYFESGASSRIAKVEAYCNHIKQFMQHFDALCHLHLKRNRVVDRFKSMRKHQSAQENIANDIMRGESTAHLSKSTRVKRLRHDTILNIGASLQYVAMRGNPGVPHKHLFSVLSRRRNRNEPVMVVRPIREAGSSQYCCSCYKKLGKKEKKRDRKCKNRNCTLHGKKVNRDRSASIIQVKFAIWETHYPFTRDPPFKTPGGGGGGGGGEMDID
jgi:hypothetical protein